MSSLDMPALNDNAQEDYDGILKSNAANVFSEPDPDKRMAALHSLWAADGVLIEREAVSTGYAAISSSVGALLGMLPPGTTFVPEGTGAGHHGLSRLRWRATSANGEPVGVYGTDLAFLSDGRIQRLYVILDPQVSTGS